MIENVKENGKLARKGGLLGPGGMSFDLGPGGMSFEGPGGMSTPE